MYWIYECQGTYGICREDNKPQGAILLQSADKAEDLRDDLQELRSNLR
jgi:hypothetical protein